MRLTTGAGVVACFAVVVVVGCTESKRTPTSPSLNVDPPGGSTPPTSPGPNPPATPAPVPGGMTAEVVAVGDIGMCSEREAVERTAATVDRLPGALILAGDLAYPHGSLADFQDCFEPASGRFRGRWYPTPGNHEYETANANGYKQYFGLAATPRGHTYYAFRHGEWLVLMLDSSIPVRMGSAQYEFVRSTLAAGAPSCTLAVWHHPLFSSGPNGANTFMRDIWQLLFEQNADVVVSGHDHLYERFGKQDADGRSTARGLRQFVVGTGGARLYDIQRLEANSQARHRAHGVLRLTLMPSTYQWAFIDVTGAVLDAGSDGCH